MGEAKRKAARLAEWESGLNEDERVVLAAARKAFERFVVPKRAVSMCYRLAFFLSAYLHHEHGIKAAPVVGYVNDGTGDVMTSHAWLMFNGKRVDISLAYTPHPSVPPGEVIMLDAVVRPGHKYTYHLEQSEAGLAQLKELAEHPAYAAAVANKEQEHNHMLGLANDPDRVLEYLNSAPDGFSYDALRSIIDRAA